MLDVAYPIANKSKAGDDFELRYSLRSLEQQNWVKDVYLIGHCPKWVQEIIHYPCSDPYTNTKDANIINKIMLASSIPGITENFVVNSDDQYFLKPIAEEDLFPVLENPYRMDELKRKCGQNTWFRRVVDTANWCKARGYSDWVFQCHIPYVVNKYDYPQCMSQLAWGQGNGFTTHAYLNMTLKEEPVKEPAGRTIRVQGRIMDLSHTRNATFLNHNDAGLTGQLISFIENRFPDKSRWEK
jgi:hypothetical protein